jgi:hypothetical protein
MPLFSLISSHSERVHRNSTFETTVQRRRAAPCCHGAVPYTGTDAPPGSESAHLTALVDRPETLQSKAAANRISLWLDLKSAYQAMPSHNKSCYRLALTMLFFELTKRLRRFANPNLNEGM